MSKFKPIFIAVWIAVSNISDIYGFATSVFEKVNEVSAAHMGNETHQPAERVSNETTRENMEIVWSTGPDLVLPTSLSFTSADRNVEFGPNPNVITFSR
jgi:hypothetical protein